MYIKNYSLLIIITLLFFSSVSSQFNENPIMNFENEDLKPLNWGFLLGVNQYDFKFEYKNDLGDILVDKSLGFNVGLIGELRLNQFLDIRIEPSLSLVERTLGFRSFDNKNDAIRKVQSTYVNFPLLLKISTNRIGNWKPILLGGISTSINLGSNEDRLEDNSSATFRMKKNTYYYEMGFGIELYPNDNFKFTPSIRGVFAINNELVPDNDPNSPWTGNIYTMKTRGIFINFTFE